MISTGNHLTLGVCFGIYSFAYFILFGLVAAFFSFLYMYVCVNKRVSQSVSLNSKSVPSLQRCSHGKLSLETRKLLSADFIRQRKERECHTMLCGGILGRSIASVMQLSPMKNRITKSNVFELDTR